MMSASRLSLLAAVLLLAGCASYSAVPPAPTAVKGAMTVQPASTWARVNRASPDSVIFAASGPVETWTIDGEQLDSVMFFAGVADGQPLLALPQEKGAPLSPYRADMSPNDIMDLFESMLTRVTNTAVARSRDLRPAKLGAAEGFRFEIDYTLKDDVDRTLSAVGAFKGGRLYLIAFQGDKLFHYQKYLPEFDKMVATAVLSGS